ncbi:MAG TPA: hypothetical protein VIT19_04055, partial [Pyrinomonadaceae bacterium]
TAMKLTTWEGGGFMLEGQTTKTFCFVEPEGQQFRARITAVEGWPDDFDFEAYEGCGATEGEAIEKLTNSLPPEPAPRIPPNHKPCVLCGLEVGFWPVPGRNKVSMRFTHGLPDVYIVCDTCYISDDTEALCGRIFAVPEARRLQSLAE